MDEVKFVNDKWIISGRLPNGLCRKPGDDGFELVDVEGQPPGECFGLWWEGFPKKQSDDEEHCSDCDFNSLCAEVMAKTSVAEELGKEGATPKTIAKTLLENENEEAINHLIGLLTPKKRKKKLPAKPKKKAPPKSVTENPTKARSAESAEERAKTKKRSAKVAVAPEGSYGAWGVHTFEERFLAERRRSHLIAQLTPGMELSREYRGELYEVKVLSKGYKYNGDIYPTLYMVTQTITGMVYRPKQKKADGTPRRGKRPLCNWSAVKFWKLKKRLLQGNQHPMTS